MSTDYLKAVKQEISTIFSSLSEATQVYKAILSHYANCPYAEILLLRDIDVTDTAKENLRKAINRLRKNEPLAYILGKTNFFGLEILCSPAALIPRPETEELVRWVVDSIHSKSRVLDLCTGSGCIALGIKSHSMDLDVEGVDCSELALALANQNAIELKLGVEFYTANILLDWTPKSTEYDVWVSNPPYIPIQEKSQMHANVTDFEPSLALFVENDEAFIFYEKIAAKGKQYLKKNGQLFVEIHEEYSENIVHIFRNFGYLDIEVRRDLQGKNRMIKAINQ